MTTPRWLWVALVVGCLASPTVGQAQARELASPRRTPSTAQAATRPAETEPRSGVIRARAAPGAIPPPPPARSRLQLVEPAALRAGASITTRLRALDTDLQVVASQGGGGIVDGVLATAMGLVSVGLGIYLDVEGGLDAMVPYLYTYGASGVLRGVLHFAFLRDPGGVSARYAHMPMQTLPEVRARLRYGEHELESLASNAEIQRILDSVLSIGTGLAVIPIYLGPVNFSLTSPFDYFVVVGAAVSAVTGVLTLFSSSEAERRWSAYRELRDRLLATPRGADEDAALEAAREELRAFEAARFDTLEPSVGVGPEGAMVGASGRF